MADITLSKAVRSNLLNLQSTATQLGKTQEKLATGLKVNSALDNPTNFFTASSLNSRAGDLGQLLDSVSNAVQTIDAADKGISAITKLVESAQATARQALQTAATVDTNTAASAGAVAGGAFTTVDVSGAGSAATNAVSSSTGFTALDLTNSAQTATQSTFTAASTFTNIDLSDDAGDALTFDVDLGGTTVSVTLDRAGSGGGGAGVDNIYDIDEAIAEIQFQLDNAVGGALGVTVGKNGGGDTLTFTADTAGATALTVDNVAVVDGGAGGGVAAAVTDLGISNPTTTGQTDTGLATVAADSVSFDLTVGATTQSITLDSSIANASGATAAADIVAAINAQFGSSVASVNGTTGEIDITDSSSTGTGSVVTIANYATTGNATTSGLADGTGNGAAATSGDSISFDLTLDSGTATTITIDSAAATTAGFTPGALTSANIASLINTQAGSTVASVNATTGGIDITSSTTGTGSDVTIANYTATVAAGSTGIADGTNTGSAASTSSTANPQREVLRAQYNDLLTQIDQLAADTSFNGVNLLNGDSLSVLFNEDGTSSLDVTGVTFNAAGLGLSELASGAFDSNADINSTLDDLKTGIDSLRSQASTFGSNLSVVETRQDFTKNIINVLETGAANLTLADSNEEAANLLALQTRQQLSSTALSLASQADQNVLRLF